MKASRSAGAKSTRLPTFTATSSPRCRSRPSVAPESRRDMHVRRAPGAGIQRTSTSGSRRGKVYREAMIPAGGLNRHPRLVLSDEEVDGLVEARRARWQERRPELLGLEEDRWPAGSSSAATTASASPVAFQNGSSAAASRAIGEPSIAARTSAARIEKRVHAQAVSPRSRSRARLKIGWAKRETGGPASLSASAKAKRVGVVVASSGVGAWRASVSIFSLVTALPGAARPGRCGCLRKSGLSSGS
jgi:hypothetical protein